MIESHHYEHQEIKMARFRNTACFSFGEISRLSERAYQFAWSARREATPQRPLHGKTGFTTGTAEQASAAAEKYVRDWRLQGEFVFEVVPVRVHDRNVGTTLPAGFEPSTD